MYRAEGDRAPNASYAPAMSRYPTSARTAKGRFLTVVTALMVVVLAAFVMAYVQ